MKLPNIRWNAYLGWCLINGTNPFRLDAIAKRNAFLRHFKIRRWQIREYEASDKFDEICAKHGLNESGNILDKLENIRCRNEAKMTNG